MKYFILTFLMISYSATAGVGLDSTRIIVSKNNNLNKSFNFISTTNDKLLVSAQVVDANDKVVDVLDVIPNVFLADGAGEYKLRIIPRAHKKTSNVEELFYLKVVSIPGSTKNSLSSNISFSIGMKIKVFYRSANIGKKNDNKDLIIVNHNDFLTFKNENPFFVILNKLTIDGEEVNLNNDDYIIKPLSILNVHRKNKAKRIVYSIINDYGAIVNKEVKL